jgi:5'-nucleotidase/UDP-sugar diphosphatase
MKTILLRCLLLLLSLQIGSCKNVEFTIFTFNDVYDIHPKPDGVGGFSTLHTMLERERKKCQYHITTMNGDFLFPSIFSSVDKGKHRVELFNQMGVDLVVLGNHEFDFGPGVVLERIKESNFPWFGANVYDIHGNYFSGNEQTKIVEVEGIKIGFFGLVTTETPIVSSTENSVLFCPLKLTAKRMCEQLKAQGADVIVALTHLFIDEDRQLAQEVPQIDVILGGHDHDPIVWYEKQTLIMKTGQNAYFLGKVVLNIDADEIHEEKRIKVYPSFEMLVNKNQVPDASIEASIRGYDTYFSSITKNVLGYVQGALDSRHAVVRSSESSMGNLILDALRERFQTDAAIMSGGIIRGDRYYPAGTPITYEDLMKELPFENENIVIEVLGKDILKALENGVALAEHLAGSFPQVSGIEYFFNKGNNTGERILDVKIQGKELEMDKLYTLATNTYNQSGGDGYFSLTNGRVLQHPSDAGKLIDVVKTYIEEKKDIASKIDGRIKMIAYPKLLDQKQRWRP